MKQREQGTLLLEKRDVRWEIVDQELQVDKIFLSINGLTSTGRTSLALTMPGPLAYIGFAENSAGLLEDVRSGGKKIKKIDCSGIYEGNEEEIKKEAFANVELYVSAISASLDFARTLVVDTHTEAWESFRYAQFGAKKPSGGQVAQNYEQINALWLGTMNRLKRQNTTHVVMLGQMKHIWKENKRTGFREKTERLYCVGNGQVEFKSELILVTRNEARRRKGVEEPEIEFSATVQKPCYGLNKTRGRVFTNDSMASGRLNLPEILEAVTGLGDWE